MVTARKVQNAPGMSGATNLKMMTGYITHGYELEGLPMAYLGPILIMKSYNGNRRQPTEYESLS